MKKMKNSSCLPFLSKVFITLGKNKWIEMKNSSCFPFLFKVFITPGQGKTLKWRFDQFVVAPGPCMYASLLVY